MSITTAVILTTLVVGGGILIFLFDRLFRMGGQKQGDWGSSSDGWAPRDDVGDGDGGD